MLKQMLDRLSGPRSRQALTFDEAHQILERTSAEAKAELAEGAHQQEILSYLAGDTSAAIRARVAANRAAPPAVDLDLADDEDVEVRAELARKIGRLVPGLSPRETEKLRETSILVLERLAADSLPRVRQIVAEEVKAARNIPKALALQLAKDAEIAVAAPVLQYSPLLVDDDLLEIIATSEVEGVLEAIAKREDLSADVSEAVVATLDIPAVAALLANKSAEFRAVTLEYLVENAANVERWHQPLVVRPELSLRAIRRIASFAASSLLEVLAARHDLDDETKLLLSSRVRERLKTDTAVQPNDEKAHERAISAVAQAMKSGRLNDDFLADAVASDDRVRVTVALATLAEIPEAQAERVLKSGNGQTITAVVWAAGLSMRTAFLLQRDVAKLAPPALVPARNGVDFPFTEQQMKTHLSLLGIPTKG